LAHYWNVDEHGNFIDCSPMDDVEGEYVVDSEIGVFSSMNHDELLSNVCSSLLFSKDKILGVDFRKMGKEYRDISDFSTESLFAEYKK
jgi:hypothetical protein